MDIISVVGVAAGLAADAFAVSVCKGLSVKAIKIRHAVTCAVWFGIFQALMPAAGFFVGINLASVLSRASGYIAFAILLYLGISMIISAFSKKEENIDDSFGIRKMFVLAVATSIDALAVGFAFSLADQKTGDAVLSFAIIGLITFILSFMGVYIGNAFGKRFEKTAKISGGVILIAIGVKMLIEGINSST